MKIAGFEFVDGARFQAGSVNDPDMVGKHLMLLREKSSGQLLPENVLEDARSDNSPLHSYFEWDDSAAAEKYRMEQARKLIRSMVAIYTPDERPDVKIRAFVHIKDVGKPHYRETSDAMSREDMHRSVLIRARDELNDWYKRYKDLQEFAELFPILSELHRQLSKGLKKAA